MKTSSVDCAILELFDQKNSHLKAHEVYEQLQQRLPALNPSTVYRALERLALNGKVSVSDMGTGASVYEKVTDGIHHHLICQKCGRIMTIDHPLVGDFFYRLETEQGFRVATNHLVLFGVCKGCVKEEK